MRSTTYTKEEMNIVEAGLSGVWQILMGTDVAQKCSLLFCLDRYLDPYYGYHLDYEEELLELLETVVVSPNALEVREDALELLTSYAWGPFRILERHFDELPVVLKPHVKYTINMHRVAKIEQLVLKECQKLYEENQALNADYDMGIFPEEAVIIYDTAVSPDNDNFAGNSDHNLEGVWRLKQGEITSCSISRDAIPRYSMSHCDKSRNNCFYLMGSFYFNIDLDAGEVCLIYLFGPRYGRCLVYQITEADEEFLLEKPKAVWVI